MHKFMNELCLNCNKFSHCNNNDLICISKYKIKEQECEELKERINTRCFDTRKNNNRCISYNRMAEDYEKDLKRIDKYKQALDEIETITSKCYISKDDYNRIRNSKWVYAFSKGYATARWELVNPIQDIINKVKENINES